MTTIGELRLRLGLEQPQETDDGMGGVTRTWTDAGSVWAALEPLAMNSGNVADRDTPTLRYRLTLRPYPDLSVKHRFRLGNRILQIRAMRDADARGEFVECLVEEERP
ncbi:MAG TPA: phage head closure protein [Xanthobacteraceae bacterium]|nr:phage head closure protein [Xanthobacteraceae bacterium]